MVPDFWDIVWIPNALALAISVGVKEFKKTACFTFICKTRFEFCNTIFYLRKPVTGKKDFILSLFSSF